jgi:hypothetical protein
MSYDSSVGFHDRAGFRAGTCRPFTVFDIEQRKALDLQERPLIVMDGTLWVRMGLSQPEALAAIQRYAQRCRESAGTLTLLWHNSSFLTGRDRDWYRQMVRAVSP